MIVVEYAFLFILLGIPGMSLVAILGIEGTYRRSAMISNSDADRELLHPIAWPGETAPEELVRPAP